MRKITTALAVLAAGMLGATAPVWADPPLDSVGARIVADIGNDGFAINDATAVTLPQITDLEVIYPEPQQQLKISGSTIVAVQLSATGKVTRASVLQSSGNHNLDTEALWGVSDARYKPGTVNGRAVSGTYSVCVDFVDAGK